MADDVYKIKADVSQYHTAIDKLVTSHEKLLQAESAHASKLATLEAAEKGATHSISGVTKAGLAFSSTFKEANGVLTQTAAKLDVLKTKGGQSVLGSISKTVLSQAKNVTTPQVVKIDKAVGQLDELITKNKFSKKQLENVWRDLQLGIGSKLEGELGKAQAVLRTLSNLTKQIEVKTLTPDFSKNSATVSSLSKDKATDTVAQTARIKAVTAAEATANKLESIEIKSAADILAIKKKANAALLTVEKAKRAQLKATNSIAGVRAQAKAQREIEEGTVQAIIKIAEKKKKALDALLSKLNTARSAHNTTVENLEKGLNVKLAALLKAQEVAYKASLAKKLAAFRTAKEKEKALAGKQTGILLRQEEEYKASLARKLKALKIAKDKEKGLTRQRAAALLQKQEAGYKASLAKRLKIFKAFKKAERAEAARQAANSAEETRVRKDRGVVTGLPVGKKVTSKGLIDLHKTEATLLKFLAANRKGVADQIISIKRLGVIWKAVGEKNIRTLKLTTLAEQELLDKINDVRHAHSRATATGGHSSNKLIRQSHALTGALEQQKKQLLGVTLSWQTMFRLIISQATSRVLTSFLSELREARDTALELSKNFARIQTLDNTNTPISAWTAGVRELSENSGLDILDQTKAAYEALSNQIGEGTSSLGFLNDANELAIISGASAAEAGTLLADAIHAWGLEIEDSGAIAAKFFKIVDLGRATVAEMAPNLGRVAVPAAQLGVTLEEVGAALATTTIKGVKLETASTLLRNVLLKLAKPSEALKELMNKLGFETGEAWIETRTLGGVLADLEVEAGGSSSAIAKLFPNIRSMTGATIFAGDGLNIYKQSLEGINKATKDYDNNVQKVKDSLGVLYDVASEKISNIFIFDTAQPLLQYVADLTNNFDDLVGLVEKARVAFITLGTAALPIAALGVLQLVKATAGLAITILGLSNPFLAVAAVAATAYGAIAGFSAATAADIKRDNAKLFVVWLKDFEKVERVSKETYAALRAETNATFKRNLAPVRDYFRQVAIAANKIAGVNKETLKTLNANIREQERLGLDSLNKTLATSRQKVSSLTTSLDALKQSAVEIAAAVAGSELNTSLVGETDLQKIITLNDEIERLNVLRGQAETQQEFQGLSKQIDAATRQKHDIQLKITADPAALEAAYDDAFDRIEARLRVFKNQGNTLGVAETKAEYIKLLALYKTDTGLKDVSNQYANILADIKIVKAELTAAEKGSNLFFNLKNELANLEQLKEGIGSIFQTTKATGFNTAFKDAKAEELQQQKQLTIALEAMRQKELSAIDAQRTVIASLTADYKALTSFKVEDFKTTEATTKTLKTQLELIRKIRGVQGKGALGGAEFELRGLARDNTAKTSGIGGRDSRVDLERLVKESQTQQAEASRNVKAADTAVQEAVGTILDFAAKLNVTEARDTSVRSQAAPPELLDALFESMTGWFSAFAAGFRGELVNPQAALLGPENPQYISIVDPEVTKALKATASEIVAISAISKKAPTDPKALDELKGLLQSLELRDPKVEKIRTTDPSKLDADGRIKLAEAISKLTIVEQLLVKMTQENTPEALGKAREQQGTARSELVALDQKIAKIGENFPKLESATKENITELKSNTTAVDKLALKMDKMSQALTGAPSLKVLPNTKQQQVLPQAGDVINITNNVNVDSPTDAEMAKRIVDPLTRLQRLANVRKVR